MNTQKPHITPLTIKTIDAMAFTPGTFPYQVNTDEKTLSVPAVLAQAVPDFVEGDNATHFIETLWYFPREIAGRLHWRVGEVQNTARTLVHGLVNQKLLDPSSLSFWNLGYESPSSTIQPTFFGG